MPGRGNNRRRKAGQGGKKVEPTSDDDSLNDACSYASGQSDNRSIVEDANDNSEVEEIGPQDILEGKLNDGVYGLSIKNAKKRILYFQDIERMFATKYMPELVEDRKLTITDSIEKALKKGGSDEQSSAARLSTLLCVQLGMYESAENMSRILKPTLLCIANDNSMSAASRSECCWALGMNQFFSGSDSADAKEITNVLSNIFAGSYLKGNGAVVTHSAEIANLHAAAISSWTLLLTIMNPSDVFKLLSSDESGCNFMPSLDRLSELLQSPHLDVRISAGEALAVIFELGRGYSEDYEQDWATELVDILRELATDSNKYRGKKDRKQQRASFRDILRYIEEDVVPQTSVRFGKETLYLEGWCARTQYDACCRLLGPGINIHLAENQLLREIFRLGNRVVQVGPIQKISKLERSLNNAAAFKARTVQMNKVRDKRSVALSM